MQKDQSGTWAGGGAPHAEKLGWRLGCQAWSFHRFAFSEALEKSAQLGLKIIEAYPGQRLAPGSQDLVLDHNMTSETMAGLNMLLEAARILLVNYGVVALPNDEAECRKVFEFAKRMGIETIVSEPPEEALAMIDGLAQEFAVNVAIHNHPKPSPYWDPKTVLEAVSQCSTRIGACADTGHWMRSEVDPLAAIRMLEGRIISFHFKDLNEYGMSGHDVPWGTGVANVRALLAEIKQQGFKGVLSIEYEHNWESSLPEIAQCVVNFDEFAEQLLQAG